MTSPSSLDPSVTRVLVNGWLRPDGAEALAEYQGAAGPVLMSYGAEIVLKTQPAETLAGEKADFVILIEFPSPGAAREAFDSPEYRALIPRRDEALERVDIVLLA